MGLDTRIIFLGYVPDSGFNELFETSDLFVTIDWADFRITTYESLQYHVPVVVSAETEYDEYLEKSGWVFRSPPEKTALAGVISNALDYSQARNTQELAHYLNNFSWNSYFEKLETYV